MGYNVNVHSQMPLLWLKFTSHTFAIEMGRHTGPKTYIQESFCKFCNCCSFMAMKESIVWEIYSYKSLFCIDIWRWKICKQTCAVRATEEIGLRNLIHLHGLHLHGNRFTFNLHEIRNYECHTHCDICGRFCFMHNTYIAWCFEHYTIVWQFWNNDNSFILWSTHNGNYVQRLFI